MPPQANPPGADEAWNKFYGIPAPPVGSSNPYAQKGISNWWLHANERFNRGWTPSQFYGNLGAGNAGVLEGFNAIASPIGLSTLVENLLSQGKTDPRAMNMQLADISRGTQSERDVTGGELARRGLTGSMGGAALQAAIGQAGQNRRAGAIAKETQIAEERKRADLDQLLRMIIQPSIDYAGIGAGLSAQNRQADQQQKAAQWAAIASLLGGFI
jgi:hypothetical protein